MIDSHCHIDLDAFDHDRHELLEKCKAMGVSRLLVLGLSTRQFSNLLLLSEQYPILDVALGCHPYFLNANQQSLAQLESELQVLASQYYKRFVAIGECGLDNKIEIDMEHQRSVLAIQIELAKQFKKPLILHHRQSHNELIKLLKDKKFLYGGILHAFSGSEQIANTYIELGFKLGVGGIITYPRAIKTRNTIMNVSLDHLVLETDAPDMPLNGFQGERNSPLQLPRVAQTLANLKGALIEEVISKTSNNYLSVMNLDKQAVLTQ